MPEHENKGFHPHIPPLHFGHNHQSHKENLDTNTHTGTLTVLERLALAEHEMRPQTRDYIHTFISDFVELHGDRMYADDSSIIGGPGIFDNKTVMVLGHQRGHTTKERGKHNFGMANPEGVHKTQRLMEHAAKFGFPILTFIDTPGAYPGQEAEERGIGQAIAQILVTMHQLPVPIISTIIGRGYSGGAMAMGGIADRILMLENSVLATISPEGAAAILWKDSEQKSSAAEAMKITAPYLYENKIIDGIIPEPPGGAHLNPRETMSSVKKALICMLDEVNALYTTQGGTFESERLIKDRRYFYRSTGRFFEEGL